MSVYSQSHFAQSYPPNFAPPSYGYAQPQPPPQAQPVFHVDPITFRRDYTSRLADLTVNSRPIIQSLSMLAQDYVRFAEIVSQCIESHIRRVPPWMKLPSFYLLDAISKNVYEPYSRVFATFVVPLFLETYNLVDQSTRSKMEEMLLTWRNGSPTGKELFGVPAQVAIERGIWGGGGSSHTDHFHASSSQITRPQVLSELEFILSQKDRQVKANPYDAATRRQVQVLHQLQVVVESGVNQDELKAILDQLRTMARSIAPPPVMPTPPPPSWPPQSQAYQAYAHPPPQPAFASQPPSHHNQPVFPVSNIAQVQPVSPPPSTSAPDITALLSNLIKAGVVSATGTPTGAGATAQESSEPKTHGVVASRVASRSYRSSILCQAVKLNSTDINKTRAPVAEFLYDHLPSQCKQCGLRFGSDDAAKKKLEDHLDMHFRQNLKANQNLGRGHSRSWFVSLEDWVHDSLDIKGKGRMHGSGPTNAKAAAAAEAIKRDAELRATHVVVPPGDEAKVIHCPICKESLKSEFLEDDEDWVWKNAVIKDGKVYHATCHAEAVSSTTTLAARLRSEMSGRSRSTTPDATGSSRSTSKSPRLSAMKVSMDTHSPLVKLEVNSTANLNHGMKRKAEDNTSFDDIKGGGPLSTPPFKKQALSAS